MGLLDTLRSALGMQRPLQVAASDAPLVLTEAARARLRALPGGHGVHVQTAKLAEGRIVQVAEGRLTAPPTPQFGADVTISPQDLHYLRGLMLDFGDSQWRVLLAFELRASEAPNPNGRLYQCTRQLAVGAPMFFASPQASTPPDLARRLLGVDGVRTVLFRHNTVTVERVPGTPWPRVDRGVEAALRHHFLLCGHELTQAAVTDNRDPLERAILEVLQDTILPGIHRDGGDLRLLGIEDGVVQVAMDGACRTCPASSATLKLGVEKALLAAFPGEVTRVEQV